jgi:hypothetical protein
VPITLGKSLGTFHFGNFGTHVLNKPCTLFDILGRKETLPSNPRGTHTGLNFHRVTFLLAHICGR